MAKKHRRYSYSLLFLRFHLGAKPDRRPSVASLRGDSLCRASKEACCADPSVCTEPETDRRPSVPSPRGGPRSMPRRPSVILCQEGPLCRGGPFCRGGPLCLRGTSVPRRRSVPSLIGGSLRRGGPLCRGGPVCRGGPLCRGSPL